MLQIKFMISLMCKNLHTKFKNHVLDKRAMISDQWLPILEQQSKVIALNQRL